jgi:hypothetical protein
MEAIVMFFVVVIGLIALDLGSIRAGTDSRDRLPDTHTR